MDSSVRTLAERLFNLKPTRAKVNCFGTVLYLAGLKADEEDVGDSEFARIFERLQRSDLPELGAIVAFVWPEYSSEATVLYYHAGIITGLSPLQIVNRRGHGGPVVVSGDLKSADMGLYPSHHGIVLYARNRAMGSSD